MREGACIGVLEGKCAFCGVLVGCRWLKKATAFNPASVISTRPPCLQDYLNQRPSIRQLGTDRIKGFCTAKTSIILFLQQGQMEIIKKESRVQNTSMNDFHSIITNLSMFPPQT
jgi:hypothetical protein